MKVAQKSVDQFDLQVHPQKVSGATITRARVIRRNAYRSRQRIWARLAAVHMFSGGSTHNYAAKQLLGGGDAKRAFCYSTR